MDLIFMVWLWFYDQISCHIFKSVKPNRNPANNLSALADRATPATMPQWLFQRDDPERNGDGADARLAAFEMRPVGVNNEACFRFPARCPVPPLIRLKPEELL